MQKTKKKYVSSFATISFALFILVMLLAALSELSPIIADYLNSTVCTKYREAMASVGDLVDFSLAEVIILLLPIWIILVILLARRALRRGNGLRFVINFAAAVLLIFSGHTVALGIAYNTTEIAEKMELSECDVTRENLSDAMIRLRDEVNSLADSVPRNSEGVFDHGYTYPELSEKICASFDSFAAEYPILTSFDSKAKGVRAGNLMSYLKITGIYTFFTGEANVNTAYPDYDTAFTAAHEMSHQRGILRENEANFIAYVVTSSSDDECLRYSAALSMYEYIGSALYRTDAERYYEIATELSESARVDMRASSAVSKKYGDTFIGELSERINDIFLKSNGTEGVVSYSRVVELTLAYFNSGN